MIPNDQFPQNIESYKAAFSEKSLVSLKDVETSMKKILFLIHLE